MFCEGNVDDGIVWDKVYWSECLVGVLLSKEEFIVVVYCSLVFFGCILDCSELEYCRFGYIRCLLWWLLFYDLILKRKELWIVSFVINFYIRVFRVMIKVIMENFDYY